MNDETKYLILMPSIVKCFQNQCKTVQSHSSKSVVEADLPDIFSRYPYFFHNYCGFALPDVIAKQP